MTSGRYCRLVKLRGRILVGALCLLAVGAGCAAPAGASTVVYNCGANLCRISPDGTGQAQLTTDGDPNGASYFAASLSRDGTKLSYIKTTADLFVSDGSAQNPFGPITRGAIFQRLSPDGTLVADAELYSGYGVYACTFSTDPNGPADHGRHCPRSTYTLGWGPDNQLLIGADPGGSAPRGICLLASDGSCARFPALDPAHELGQPALSPDGTTLAVIAESSANSVSGSIDLYDFVSGQFQRHLTTGGSDESPVWSPDGTQIAFERAGAIDVIGAAGPAGSEHRLVVGTQPTWGAAGGSSVGTPGGSGLHVSVTVPAGQHVVRSRSLVAEVTCSTVCAAGVVGQIAIAKRHGALDLHSPHARTLAAGAPRRFSLGLSKKVVRLVAAALRAHRRVRVLVAAAGQDSGGTRRTASAKATIGR